MSNRRGTVRWRARARIPLFFLLASMLLAGCGGQGAATAISTAAVLMAVTPTATLPTPRPTPTVQATTPPTAAPRPTAAPSATATMQHQAAAAPPSGAPASPAVGLPPAQGTAGATVIVRIVNFAFDPAVVTVPVGTTVVWELAEGYHTVLGADGRIDSPPLEDPGDRYAYTFTAPGNYDYICGIHPDMLGSVHVIP